MSASGQLNKILKSEEKENIVVEGTSVYVAYQRGSSMWQKRSG